MRESEAHRKGPRKSFLSKAAVCVEKTAVWEKRSGASDFHHQAHQAGFCAQKRPNIGFCLFAVLLGFINGRLYCCWMSHCADFGFPESQAGVCTTKQAFCTTKRAFVLPSRCFAVQTGAWDFHVHLHCVCVELLEPSTTGMAQCRNEKRPCGNAKPSYGNAKRSYEN